MTAEAKSSMGKGKYGRKKKHRQNQAQEDSKKTPPLNKEGNPEAEAKDGAFRKDETNSDNNCWMRFWEFLKRSSLTDWLLTVFTLVLAAFAIFQFIIIDSQLDVMRKDERAWIVPVAKGFEKMAINAPVTNSLTVTNTGKTPASDVVVSAVIQIVNKSQPPNLDLYRNELHTVAIVGTLFPNDSHDVRVTRYAKSNVDTPESESRLKAGEDVALKNGQAYLAIYGIINYSNAFKTRHWVEFCMWGFLTPPPEGYMTGACSDFNRTDAN